MVTTNQKPTIDTQKQRDRNTSIPLKEIMKPQKKKKKKKKKERNNTEGLPRQLENQ